MSIRNTARLQRWAVGWWNCHSHRDTHSHNTQGRWIVTTLSTWGCDCMERVSTFVSECSDHGSSCALSPRGTSPDPGPASPEPTGLERATPPTATISAEVLVLICGGAGSFNAAWLRLLGRPACVFYIPKLPESCISTHSLFGAISSSHNLPMREKLDRLLSWSEAEKKAVITW